ncbi:MAG TPA: iron chaperone [Sphingobacteriaceae bacterium]|nr:iron chaperone [Sphingobacteriaceae bacterium]
MEVFADYLDAIENLEHRARTQEVLAWVMEQFPDLEPHIKWNQPMFTHRGSFIVGFSVAKKHLAVAPEAAGIQRFSEEIVQAGYEHTKMLIRFPWNRPVDYPLLQRIIQFNITDKAGSPTFWRKS